MNGRAAWTDASVARDEWLSSQLGRVVWKVEPDCDPATALNQAGSGCAMFFARVETAATAAVLRFEQAGFHVVDTTLTLEADAAHVKRVGAPVRLARAEDRAAVARIAEHSFEWSRLHLDPAVPRRLADTSRRNWAENYFNGGRGDAMIIGETAGTPAAFLLAIGPVDGLAVIDLIAVDASARRQGLGAASVGFLASMKGVNRLRVGTQAANIGSVHFYEALGFRMVASHYVLHKHRN